MDRFLQQLAKRLKAAGGDIVTAEEMAGWPGGKLDELLSQGFLKEIEHAKGLICDQCEERCFIEPETRVCADGGEPIGNFICTRNPDIGQITIDLGRLRQWRISGERLADAGVLKAVVGRRKRRVSSELTPRETEAYGLVYVQRKTAGQAAIEMGCSAPNVSKLLKKALVKLQARSSRSLNQKATQQLRRDDRSQIDVSENDLY